MKYTPIDRRQVLLSGLSWMGAAALLPHSASAARRALQETLATAGAADLGDRILVVVQMYGGNDGLNTVVPFENDVYHNQRPAIRLAPDELLKIDELRGFHPKLANLFNLWKQGEVAIVEGCGYPDPVLSHFKSFDIWNHASRTGTSPDGDGWLGRLRRLAWGADRRSELVMHVGGHVPSSIHSTTHPAVTFETPESYVWVGDERAREAYRGSGGDPSIQPPAGEDRAAVLARLRGTLNAAQATSPRILKAVAEYQPQVAYPAEDTFAQDLKVVAALIRAGFDTRIYSVSIGNFDQHGPQRRAHDPLLESLDRGVSCLLEDLRGTAAGEKTVVLAFSEFGRRVEENASGGTDHGAAGPMFVFGQPVRGGLYGQHPSLTDLDENGNLVHTTDFRSVYATLAEQWLGVPQAELLGESFPLLPLLEV